MIFEIPFSTQKTVSPLLAALPSLVGASAATSTGQTTTQLLHPVHFVSSSLTPVSAADCIGATRLSDGKVAGAILESKQGRMAVRASVVVDTTGDGRVVQT